MTKQNGVTYKEMVEYIDQRFDRLEEKMDKLQTQLNNQKLLASVIGGVTGTIAAIVNPFSRPS